MEAGADPTIPNKDGDLPADLLAYGTKSRSQLGQELVARLKRGQAEINVNASDIANDDDVADDGEGMFAHLYREQTNSTTKEFVECATDA